MESLNSLSLNDRKLIIGIDFGTTFSGVAWAETRRIDQHSIIETWPASLGTNEGMSCVKVPTEIRYTPQGTEWGFQIPPTVERHQWFKLGFAEGQNLEVGQTETPEELTTDYLKELNKHLMYTLEQKVGAAILRTIPLEFCLTVPAIWTEAAKEKTLNACRQAGLGSKADILLVSEPEAAAIYALHGLDPHGLNVGESFVLCDAGGGTVDLISYTITALHPMLKVKEAAGGTGGLCGSTFLNRRFAEFLTTKFGEEPGWDEEILAEAMERFDTVIKKQYSPTTPNQDGYTISVPGLANNPALGIRRGRCTIKPAEIKGIFEPIVLKVIEMVRGQIRDSNRAIRAVLLVGGFGQNNYLKERLRSSLGGIEVLQPPNAWTAIVRGAVMMGLTRANANAAAVQVESRAARKHYGIQLHVAFNDEKHDIAQRYWYDPYQRWEVREMQWFIRKGEAVEEGRPRSINFVHDFLVSAGKPTSVAIEVYHDAQSTSAPVHKRTGTTKLVTLEADLAHLTTNDLSSTIERQADGHQYYIIEGSIEATFLSASTKYVLVCQGKRYDTVTAEYV